MVLAAILTGTVPVVAAAQTAPSSSAAATTPKYSTTATDLGTLLDNPATKAILVKQVPDLVANDQIDMARSMTLRGLQQYAGDMLTDEKLNAIDTDLARLPTVPASVAK